jgi:hypothetical protein
MAVSLSVEIVGGWSSEGAALKGRRGEAVKLRGVAASSSLGERDAVAESATGE